MPEAWAARSTVRLAVTTERTRGAGAARLAVGRFSRRLLPNGAESPAVPHGGWGEHLEWRAGPSISLAHGGRANWPLS